MVRTLVGQGKKPQLENIEYFRGRLSLWPLPGLLFVLALGLPLASLSAPTPAADAPESKNILVLFTLPDPHLSPPVESLMSDVRERVPTSVNFFVEYMETQRLEDPDYEKNLSETFRYTYGGEHLDLVIVSSFATLHFALAHRDELFPGVPIVFNYLYAGRIPKQGVWPGVTGVTTTIDAHGSIDLVLRLQPDTKNLAIVAGTTEFERYWVDSSMPN